MNIIKRDDGLLILPPNQGHINVINGELVKYDIAIDEEFNIPFKQFAGGNFKSVSEMIGYYENYKLYLVANEGEAFKVAGLGRGYAFIASVLDIDIDSQFIKIKIKELNLKGEI